MNKRNKIKIVVYEDVYKKDNTINKEYFFSTPKELDIFCEKLEKNQTIKEQLKNSDNEFSLFSIQLDDEASKKYAKVIQQIDLLHLLTQHLKTYSFDKKAFDLELLNQREISLMNKKYTFSRPVFENMIDLNLNRKEKYSLFDKQNKEVIIHDISLYHINKIIYNLDKTIEIYKRIIELIPKTLMFKLKQSNSHILSNLENYKNSFQ